MSITTLISDQIIHPFPLCKASKVLARHDTMRCHRDQLPLKIQKYTPLMAQHEKDNRLSDLGNICGKTLLFEDVLTNNCLTQVICTIFQIIGT